MGGALGASGARPRRAGAARSSAVAARVGWWPRLAIVGALGALIPLAGLNDFQLQVGVNALLLAMLAVGLNIAVGWAGLLDLGYIAFYGFGAYGYALLSSNQLGTDGIHLHGRSCRSRSSWSRRRRSGMLLGLPSRRLIGDYLAIVTLFFGEVFVEVVNNVDPSTSAAQRDLRPRPVPRVRRRDPHRRATTTSRWCCLIVLTAALHLLDTSRTGRAWRAVRDDPLAARLMTVPVNTLKVMAFSFGAMVAALAGTIFAAQQGSVVPRPTSPPNPDPDLRLPGPRRRREHRRRGARRAGA